MATISKRDKTRGPFFPIVFQDGLDITIMGGMFDKKGQGISVAPASFTLTASNTNYIFITWAATPTIAVDTSGYPPKSKPLYAITADGDSITAIEDNRAVMRQSAHTQYQTKDEWLFFGNRNSDLDWTTIDVGADAPEGATGVLLGINVMDSGTPGTDVYIAFRKSGEIEVSQRMTVFPQVSGLWVGGMTPIGLNDDKEFQVTMKVSGTMTYAIQLLGWIFGS